MHLINVTSTSDKPKFCRHNHEVVACILKMDGAGNYTVDGITSYNGVITPEHFEGTYEVGDDCQVTFFVGELPAVLGIFANNRSESRAMVLIPGTNITLLTIRK